MAKAIGEQIRHYRTLAGMTQEQLAEAIESQGTYIGRVERGEQNIQLQTLEKIAEALHTQIAITFDHEQYERFKADEWIWKIVLLLKEQDHEQQQRAYRILREVFTNF
nr:helix-turn-helix transcriptional regulator [Paenibacillus tritici]